MATTSKTFTVKNKKLEEIKGKSISILKSKGFRIKDRGTAILCTRGFGLLTGQQQFSINFIQDNNDVRVEGMFYVLTYWFIKSTVDRNALAAAIPRRKGYQLMTEYIEEISKT